MSANEEARALLAALPEGAILEQWAVYVPGLIAALAASLDRERELLAKLASMGVHFIADYADDAWSVGTGFVPAWTWYEGSTLAEACARALCGVGRCA